MHIMAIIDNFLAPKASFESILGILSSFFVVENEDALFSWLRKAMLDRRLRRDMETWRAEWKELVRTEKEKDVLL
jgi:USP6 N-terminal-like protein